MDEQGIGALLTELAVRICRGGTRTEYKTHLRCRRNDAGGQLGQGLARSLGIALHKMEVIARLHGMGGCEPTGFIAPENQVVAGGTTRHSRLGQFDDRLGEQGLNGRVNRFLGVEFRFQVIAPLKSLRKGHISEKGGGNTEIVRHQYFGNARIVWLALFRSLLDDDIAIAHSAHVQSGNPEIIEVRFVEDIARVGKLLGIEADKVLDEDARHAAGQCALVEGGLRLGCRQHVAQVDRRKLGRVHVEVAEIAACRAEQYSGKDCGEI